MAKAIEKGALGGLLLGADFVDQEHGVLLECAIERSAVATVSHA
jgi:hypothetical protein